KPNCDLACLIRLFEKVGRLELLKDVLVHGTNSSVKTTLLNQILPNMVETLLERPKQLSQIIDKLTGLLEGLRGNDLKLALSAIIDSDLIVNLSRAFQATSRKREKRVI